MFNSNYLRKNLFANFIIKTKINLIPKMFEASSQSTAYLVYRLQISHAFCIM